MQSSKPACEAISHNSQSGEGKALFRKAGQSDKPVLPHLVQMHGLGTARPPQQVPGLSWGILAGGNRSPRGPWVEVPATEAVHFYRWVAAPYCLTRSLDCANMRQS